MKKIILISLIFYLIICFNTFAAEGPAKANNITKQNTEPMSFSAQGTIESSKATKSTTMHSQVQTTKSAGITAKVNSAASNESLTILKQDSGVSFSEMNMTMYSTVNDFGAAGLNVGEVVKFVAPKPGWMLKRIQIVGWSPYNNTTKKYPADRNFLIEVRDKNTDLLYKFADNQNMYFASAEGPANRGIEVPSIPVTDEFYIVFYDRGTMLIGAELNNGTGNSYLVMNGNLEPTPKINWLIRALGE